MVAKCSRMLRWGLGVVLSVGLTQIAPAQANVLAGEFDYFEPYWDANYTGPETAYGSWWAHNPTNVDLPVSFEASIGGGFSLAASIGTGGNYTVPASDFKYKDFNLSGTIEVGGAYPLSGHLSEGLLGEGGAVLGTWDGIFYGPEEQW